MQETFDLQKYKPGYVVVDGQSEPLAGIGRRGCASILDGLVLGSIFLAFTLFYAIFVPPPNNTAFQGQTAYLAAFAAWAIPLTILYNIISVVYQVYFLSQRAGQTLGKGWRSIQVVKLNGEKITVADALLRELVGKIVVFYILQLGVNAIGFQRLLGSLGFIVELVVLYLPYLWAFGDRKRQTWHDKIANTVVVQLEKPKQNY